MIVAMGVGGLAVPVGLLEVVEKRVSWLSGGISEGVWRQRIT